MSLTTNIVVIAILDLAIIAGLAALCLVPFRLDQRRAAAPAKVHRLAGAGLLEAEDAVA